MAGAQKSGIFSSIASLVIAGFAVTALPLVIALVAGSLQVNTLAHKSQSSILESVETTRASEFISDQLVSMERNARQYLVLREPSLLQVYEDRYRKLLTVLTQLETTSFGESNWEDIIAIRQAAALTTTRLQNSDTIPLDEGLSSFTSLHDHAARLRSASDAAMDENLTAVAEMSLQMQRGFLWQSTLLGISGVVFAILFVFAILRPIRQINQAITSMGNEAQEESVEVDGPRDLQEVGDRLEWLRCRLRDAEEQKSEFLRHMSHELKTPLANIREGTALMLDNAVGVLSDSQREIVFILDSSARRLHRLVDNLINFARWQTHREKTLSGFDLVDLINREVGELRLLLDKKALNLLFDHPDELSVTADQERVATFFANLLSNAIKYSPEGGTISLKVQQACSDVDIDLLDFGPGIPQEDRLKVFEPFYQGRSHSRIGGTGIGLSLVRECLEVHGGAGEFRPTARGAHFHASLPIAIEETIDAA